MVQKCHRSVIEEDSFQLSCAAIGNVEFIDLALEIITHSLSWSAEEFPLIPGMPPIRMAKTRFAVRNLKVIPALYLRFYIGRDNQVHLWHLELAPVDDPHLFGRLTEINDR